MMKTVLVTGGAGFIGSHVSERLISDGYKVISVDNFDDMYYDPKLKRINIDILSKYENFISIEGDIRDLKIIDEIFEQYNPDYIVHLAAKVDTRMALEHPRDYMSVNIDGTLNIFELAMKYGVKNIAHASSSSVYGNVNQTPFNEEQKVSRPLSAYGTSKVAGELLAYNYHHNYGMNVTCLRYFNSYGERMRPPLVMIKWMNTILDGETIEISEEGVRARDYTYIEDIVDGTVKAMEKPLGYEIINLGNNNPVSLKDLLSTIESILGMKAIIKKRPSHKASVEQTCADISKAKELLDWEPKTSLEDGLNKLATWVRGQRTRNTK